MNFPLLFLISIIEPTTLYPSLSGPTEIYYTEDSHFRIFYTLSGEDAVPSEDSNPANGIPDYIDKIAKGAGFSWQKIIDEYGWRLPGTVDIYVQKMSGGGSSSGNSIFISNNLFMPTESEIGSLVVHEFMHTVEDTYDEESPWWEEAVAEWMSHLLYGLFDVNIDFFSFQLTLMDRLGKNYLSLYDYNMAYANSLWVWFLQEWAGRGDQGIIRKMWERAGEIPEENTLESIEYVLKNNGSDLLSAFQEFTVWNYILGPYDDGKHYPNGDRIYTPYGSVKIDNHYDSYPVNKNSPIPIYPLGASYIELIPDPGSTGAEMEFNGEGNTFWGVSVILFDGQYHVKHLRADDNGYLYTLFRSWNRYEKIILVVQNLSTSGEESSDYYYNIEGGDFTNDEGCGCSFSNFKGKSYSETLMIAIVVFFITVFTSKKNMKK